MDYLMAVYYSNDLLHLQCQEDALKWSFPVESMSRWVDMSFQDVIRFSASIFAIAIQYPLVNYQFAIEDGPVEIVSFPLKHSDLP